MCEFCRTVKRRGGVYVLCTSKPSIKQRQGTEGPSPTVSVKGTTKKLVRRNPAFRQEWLSGSQKASPI